MLSNLVEKGLIFLMLVGLSILVTFLSPNKVDSESDLTVWFLDVGQGDAILVDYLETQVLIDGGPGVAVIEQLGNVMPFWDRKIEYIVNTHPHADHVSGLLRVSDYYEVGEVFAAAQVYETRVWRQFLEKMEPNWLAKGDEIILGDNVRLKVLWPESKNLKRYSDPNAGSVVMMLEYGDRRILLTGDIGVTEEEMILSEIGKVDILKVAHQGSYTSSSRRFLESIRPDYAIITVGENTYGHPHQVVLNRLAEFAKVIYRTDRDGTIKAKIFEDRVEVEPVGFR
jgi:competence protein ComEC